MKYEQHTDNNASYAYRVNFLDDVLDLDRFKPKRFKNFKELVQVNREREAKMLAKEIFNDFLLLVGKDMIDENNIYMLPFANYGYMKIADVANRNSPDYVFNFDTDGAVYGPKIKLDRRFLLKNKVHYRMQFGKFLKNRLEEKVASGHKYE